MIDVTVVLLGDGMASTAMTPVEIFFAAGALWNELSGRPPQPAFRVRTASVDGKAVISAYGVGLTPHMALADVEHTDLILVSASRGDFDQGRVGASPLPAWLAARHAQGAYVVGVCTGAAYLAEAGLLDGRIATTHWAMAEAFAQRYPKVRWRPEYFVTEDRRVLCGGGVYASADVSLYLVEKFAGRKVALETAKALLLPMPRASQAGYAMLPVSQPHDDETIRAVELYLEAHYAQVLTTGDLADRAGMGAKTFVRRFKAATGKQPAAYLQALRMEAAKAMLEAGGKSVQTIGCEVGYNDQAFFRALFKRVTGMTPADYRASFAPLATPLERAEV